MHRCDRVYKKYYKKYSQARPLFLLAVFLVIASLAGCTGKSSLSWNKLKKEYKNHVRDDYPDDTRSGRSVPSGGQKVQSIFGKKGLEWNRSLQKQQEQKNKDKKIPQTAITSHSPARASVPVQKQVNNKGIPEENVSYSYLHDSFPLKLTSISYTPLMSHTSHTHVSSAQFGPDVTFSIHIPNFNNSNSTSAARSEQYQKIKKHENGKQLKHHAIIKKKSAPSDQRSSKYLSKILSNHKVNLLLWIASYQVLRFTSMDFIRPKLGIMETGWYVDPSTQKGDRRFKVLVSIVSPTLSYKSLQIEVFEQVFVRGLWRNSRNDPRAKILRENLQDMILSKARNIDIKSISKQFSISEYRQ